MSTATSASLRFSQRDRFLRCHFVKLKAISVPLERPPRLPLISSLECARAPAHATDISTSANSPFTLPSAKFTTDAPSQMLSIDAPEQRDTLTRAFLSRLFVLALLVRAPKFQRDYSPFTSSTLQSQGECSRAGENFIESTYKLNMSEIARC